MHELLSQQNSDLISAIYIVVNLITSLRYTSPYLHTVGLLLSAIIVSRSLFAGKWLLSLLFFLHFVLVFLVTLLSCPPIDHYFIVCIDRPAMQYKTKGPLIIGYVGACMPPSNSNTLIRLFNGPNPNVL